MANQPIPFGNMQSSGMDELSGGVVVAMNVITEPQGAVRRRPGIRLIDEAPEEPLADGPVTGLYYTQNRELFAVVDSATERPIFRVKNGAALALGGGTEPAGLRGSARPSFAETPMLLVLAGGDRMQKVELATLVSTRLRGLVGGLEPPIASHVTALSSRLVANDLVLEPGTVRFSAPQTGTTTYEGHEDWSVGIDTGGAVPTEGQPDNCIALVANTSELFLFGTRTLQIFSPDGALENNAGYLPVSAVDIGLGAANSVILSEKNLAWIDERKRVLLGDGRTYDVVSGPIQRDLERSGISGVFAYRVHTGPLDAMVWAIPSDGRTFVLQKGFGWSQWQSWGGNWTRFPVTAHHQRWSDAANLVGLEDGRIAELSFDASTDLGVPIRAYVRTGYQSRGTASRKQCLSVRLRLRRGEETGGAPHGWLRFRDREGPWQSIPIDLGSSPDFETTVSFRGLGVYRERQWEFEFTGSAACVLLSAEEEFAVLEA